MCLSLTNTLLPFAFCTPDALLLKGALLAESSGITSPEENCLSFAATRDKGARNFAPDVDGRLLLSAAVLAFAEVDIFRIYPFTLLFFYVSCSSYSHYCRHGVVDCGVGQADADLFAVVLACAESLGSLA